MIAGITGPHMDDGHGFVAIGLIVFCVIPHFVWMYRSGWWRDQD